MINSAIRTSKKPYGYKDPTDEDYPFGWRWPTGARGIPRKPYGMFYILMAHKRKPCDHLNPSDGPI